MTLCPFWRYSVSPTTSPGSTLKWRLSPSPIISAANTLSSTSASFSSHDFLAFSHHPPPLLQKTPPHAPFLQHHPVPFNTSGEERAARDQDAKGWRSKWNQLQAPEVPRWPTVWHHVQHEPEARESTTAVKDILYGTSTKDHASGGPQQPQAGSTDLTSD